MIRFAATAIALALTAPAIAPAPQAQEGLTIEGIVAILNDSRFPIATCVSARACC